MLLKKIFLGSFLFPTLSYANTLPTSNIDNSLTPNHDNLARFSLGDNSQASGSGATAIGINSQATNTRAVAIGYGALANEENTVSFGNSEEKQTARLTNVSEGKNNTDAVNLAQTKALLSKNKRLTDSQINVFRNQTNNNLNTIKKTIHEFDDYYRRRQASITDAIEALDKKVISLEKKVYAGIASSIAMTNIPYLTHHTFSGGIGISNYRTGIALAGGIQYQPNNDIAFRFNSSINSEQELIFGGGLAYGW
ncbi:trimeric autotransporter adhesin AipA [Proteus mirabilis]|uniref:trimeric autotransporter adhesin AipA n=1 Tax=Proteus mirabilis TaxID=584 RepID=UPI00101F770C|nr:trimeric autotransporter adhesin AipA [Proteus mirabilis]RZA37525.1 hemagglutinin [Proteus mirabilis]